MPQRVQVDPGLRVPGIRPAAAPVDTFVRPQTDTKLDQLSNALSRISPKIEQFGGAVQDYQDANASEAGRQAAEQIRNEGLSLAEATRKGKIPASHNPYFMQGLREQLGRNMADKFHGDLISAAGQDESLSYATDVKDFDKFASEFRDKWTKENIGSTDQDQSFNTGFQYRADAGLTDVRNGFASGIEAKVMKQAGEATHQDAVGVIQNTIAKGQPMSVATSAINQLVTDLTKQGRPPANTLRSVAQAVADAALADPIHSDVILEMMKDIQGKHGALSTTSYGMELADKVHQEVANRNQQKYRWEGEQAEARKKAGVESVIGQLNDALAKSGDNAHTIDLTPFRAAMNKIDPMHVATLDGIQDGFVQHEFKEDPHIADDLYTRIHTVGAGEPGYVDVGAVSRVFGSPLHPLSQATYRAMVTEIQERDKAGLEKSAQKDPWFTEGSRRVYRIYANEMGDTQENRIRAESAQTEFQAAYIKAFKGKTGAEFDDAKDKFIYSHITHELTDKGDNITRKTFEKTPPPQFDGPQHADWTKVPVIDRTTLHQMQSQLSELSAKHIGGLSESLTRILRTYGVKPDVGAIQEFLFVQKRILDSGRNIQP